MTRKEYADKCIGLVEIMREASAEDSALAEFLKLFDLLQGPSLEDPSNG